MEKELRYLDLEYRSKPDNDRLVEGYALLFDTESTPLYDKKRGVQFTEVIERGSLDGVIEKSDVCCFLNHDPNRGILARSTNGIGTLKLEVDERGLKYSFVAPNTALGDELLEGLRRGDIRSSSFAFTLNEKNTSLEKRNSNPPLLRRIKKFEQVADVSPVFRPAYNETSVSLRGYEEFIADDTKHTEEVNGYYSELKKKFNFLK